MGVEYHDSGLPEEFDNPPFTSSNNEESDHQVKIEPTPSDSQELMGGGDDISSNNLDSSSSSILAMLQKDPPPDPLPDGWVMHRSISQQGYVYYFQVSTGRCQWESPVFEAPKLTTGLTEKLNSLHEATTAAATTTAAESSKQISNLNISTSPKLNSTQQKQQQLDAESGSKNAVKSILKSQTTAVSSQSNNNNSSKRSRGAGTTESSNAEGSTSSDSPLTKKQRHSEKEPEQVRVLHILKKHNKSRRPASWRSKQITISKQEAISELRELISILNDSAQNPKELRATFEELAKTESDCSSAKRGGDVGFFGRKKMQPNFEKASFALNIGELSDIVDTSSGVHVILRLG